MTLDRILHEIANLKNDMRTTNVRSYGLKTTVHEQWCQRIETIEKMVKQHAEAHVQQQLTHVPPAPPE